MYRNIFTTLPKSFGVLKAIIEYCQETWIKEKSATCSKNRVLRFLALLNNW